MADDFYVYALYRDLEMQDPFYIGKGRGTRMHRHEKSTAADPNFLKTRAIKKRIEDFGFVPKAVISAGLSELEAYDLEKTLIAQWGRLDAKTGRLTNMTEGGVRGPGNYKKYKNSLVTRAKISINKTGKKLSDEHRAAISASQKGKNTSIETRRKMSAWQIGKVLSEETKAKISAKAKGRKPPESYYEKRAAQPTTEAMLKALEAGRATRLENCKRKREESARGP